MSYMFKADMQSTATGIIPDNEYPVPPYGGNRVNQSSVLFSQEHVNKLTEDMPSIAITTDQARLVCLIATGALSPVNGLMTLDDAIRVINDKSLDNGLPWGEVVTLNIKADQIDGDVLPEHIMLTYSGDPVAVVETSELFRLTQLTAHTKKSKPACFGFNEHHQDQNDVCIAGRVWVLMSDDDIYRKYGLLTAEHVVKSYRGNNNLAIFGMTPWSRISEYILKTGIEHYDTVLMFRENKMPGANPVKKEFIRQACDVALDNFVAASRLIQIDSVIPDFTVSMRSLMTRVIISRNYGCGAVRIVAENNIERAMLKQFAAEISRNGSWKTRVDIADDAYYCNECESIVTHRTCPHENEKHTCLDDVCLADMLSHGKMLPSYIARPAVSRLLAKGVVASVTHEKTRYIFPHKSAVTADTRSLMAGHQPAVLWMTGLSGSGKSTIANLVEKQLLMSGHRVYILDGDSLRNGLCGDLGFSQEDRQENIRRAGEAAKLMCDAGMVVIASFISPFREEREKLRANIGKHFYEVYIEADLDTCESRDPKGLYQRARDGVIKDFTGISSPYEAPLRPDVHIDTARSEAEGCAMQIMKFLTKTGLLRNGASQTSTDHISEIRPQILN
ncbi:MAG: adenylyl-sulfate kinase [Proteobacteria bacterium]|nr:adenylyl-sulfate kinase [Pseudomonadota bacterium]